MKRVGGLVLLAFIGLAAFGCGGGPQNLIVGKWEAGQPGLEVKAEFKSDGTATLSMLGNTRAGTYKLIGNDQLEVTVSGTTIKYQMKLTATQLELTSGGTTISYKKV